MESTSSRAQYRCVLKDASSATLTQWVPKLVEKLRAAPELQNVSTNFMDRGLSATVAVDRDTSARLGLTPSTNHKALYDVLGPRLTCTLQPHANPHRLSQAHDP